MTQVDLQERLNRLAQGVSKMEVEKKRLIKENDGLRKLVHEQNAKIQQLTRLLKQQQAANQQTACKRIKH